MIVRALKDLAATGEAGQPLKGIPQPVEGVTYAAKLDRAQAAIDPALPAQLLARRVRAFNPAPGATITLPGLADPVKVWQARAIETHTHAAPGTVLRASPDGIDIATGDGVLQLLELQRAGGKRQSADVFIRGWSPPG
jgi:methionyl-tRNA formyltransferase